MRMLASWGDCAPGEHVLASFFLTSSSPPVSDPSSQGVPPLDYTSLHIK